jgi:hypothetical protein
VPKVGNRGPPGKPPVSLTFPLHKRAIALSGFATMAKALTKSQIVAPFLLSAGHESTKLSQMNLAQKQSSRKRAPSKANS